MMLKELRIWHGTLPNCGTLRMESRHQENYVTDTQSCATGSISKEVVYFMHILFDKGLAFAFVIFRF